jgi:hypothetical protein
VAGPKARRGADEHVRLKNWTAYLTDGLVEALVTIDPAVLERIWAQTDGSIAYLTRRGLRELAEKLEAEQPVVEGSRDSGAAPPRWTPPVVDDPLSREEMIALNRRLLDIARGRRAG